MERIGESIQITGLTKTENEIIEAASGIKIRNVILLDGIIPEAQSLLTETLMRANINLGGKKIAEMENFNILLVSVIEMLAEKHQYASINEVCKAILYGSLGEFKKGQEALYLSATNIHLWIKDYLNEKKLPAFAKKARLPIPEKMELTEKEKEEILINGLKSKFEKFKTGEFSDIGNASYEYLDSRGLIPFTVERKRQFMEQAVQEIKSSKKAERAVVGQMDMFKINKFLKDLEAGQKKQDIVIAAKKIALRTLFTDLLEMGEDIETLLNQ
jgi:hypothetical protein